MATSSKKFNLTELLNQRSKEAAPQGQQGAEEAEKDTAATAASTTADIYDLIPSKDNFYSVEDVQDLKQSIELLGILQPLLVTNEEDGKRRIIAGHRRRLAIMQLVDEGKERFRYVPIMVKPTKNAILDRLALIMTNRFREKTDWEKMTESIETEKLVQELKEQMDIPGRTRDLLAEIIETSPAQLGRYKAIYNNLAAELMVEFKAGKIGVSVIYEISQLEKEWQLRSLEVFRENGTLALPDIKEIKRQQEAAAQVPGQIKMEDLNGQQDTQEAAQTEENAEGEEITEEEEKTAGKGAEEAKEGEYVDPQPESIVSLCYSCIKYETCHDKKATVTSCNAYENRKEAYKTDEQRYNEEQAKIDAETRRKLMERQQEEAQQEERKKKEIALIEADEWKKRAKEKDEEITKLKRAINEQDRRIEQLERQQDRLKTEAEMARAAEEKTRREYAEKEDCAAWLKKSLQKYCGHEWEKVTKTQLVDILKKILSESERQQG